MGVIIGNINALMTHTVCNGDCGKAHINQQRYVAVAKLVEAEIFMLTGVSTYDSGKNCKINIILRIDM